MKIIFSQDFITDSSRKDCYLVMSTYFLAKVSGGGKAFNGWNDLTSPSTLAGFSDVSTNRTRTSNIDVDGLWDLDSQVLKLHIKIPEGQGFNINERLMDYSLGYFYYQLPSGEEKIAFVIISDDSTLNEYGTLSVHESDSLGLVLGSNLVNIPTIPTLQCGISCKGQTQDTEFLEGHGVYRGVDIWAFPDSQGLIYASSAKDYLLSGLREKWFGADIYPDPNGLTGENITKLRIPTTISLNNTTSELVVGGLGGAVKVSGTYGWDEYAITSTSYKIVSSGTSDISELEEGSIQVNGAPEGMINSIDWKEKVIYIDPCPQSDILRTASVSVSTPSLVDNRTRSLLGNSDKVLTTITSSPQTIEQENSTSVWEITIPIQGYTENDIPVVRLDWATLKGISGRTNKDFVIVTEKGEEPEEGNWIRVDCDWDGWREYINLIIDKYNNSNLWWDLKISISPILDKIIDSLPDTPPTCYVVLGGSEVREFILEFPESLFPGMPKPTYRQIDGEEESILPVETIEASWSDLMEVNEIEIFPETQEIPLFLNLPEESLVTIYTPDNSPIDVIFRQGESNTVLLPAVGKTNLSVLIKDAEDGVNEDLSGKIVVTDPRTGENKKELGIVVKKGRIGVKKKKKKSTPLKSTSSVYFHSQGISLTGLWEQGSENIITTGFDSQGIDLEKTTLRMKLGEQGFIPILDFGWIKEKEGKYTLLARLPQNSTSKILGKDIDAWIDLWSWEKESSIWTAKIYQGTTCVETTPDTPEVLEIAGAKNSVFPERKYWTLKSSQKEYISPGKLETIEDLPIQLENVVWGKGNDYLLPNPELKLLEGNILQPLFNVTPDKYTEEFNINVTGSFIVQLPKENIGLISTGPIPFSLWMKKPKLNDK